MSSVGTAMSGQIAQGLYELAKNSALRFSSRWHRLDRVRRAYRARANEITLDPIVQAAVRDIATVIGQDGQLTEDMDRFLNVLGNSGLLDHLVLIAITNINPAGTLPAFRLLYEAELSTITRARLGADALYEKLLRMLRASILGNEDLGDYLSRETLTSLRNIGISHEAALKSRFVVTHSNGEELSSSEFIKQSPWLSQERSERQDVLSRLGAALTPIFANIRVEGPQMRSVDVDASKIYVESVLNAVEFNPTSTDGSFSRNDLDRELSNLEFVRTISRAAVVGDPGGGKSTFTRMICRDLLSTFRLAQGAFPIFVTLRKFYTARRRENTLPLFEYLLRELCEQSNSFTVDELRAPIQYLLTFGQAFVVLDGLDEIISIAQRREFSTAVSQFCATYHLCRFVVTSRKVDYRKVSLAGFTTFELAPFDEHRVRAYVSASAEHVFHRKVRDIPREVDRFMEAVQRNASEFRSNPLLLSLIVWLFNSTQRIPDNRAEIYEECSQLLFERWDSLREISPDVPDAHRLFTLLAYLASEMYLRPDLQTGASREWLKVAIRDYFISDYSENAAARANVASEKFLEHLAGRAWVLRAIGNDRYEFTHRTFMEYFFARYLTDKNLSLEGLIDELVPHISSGEWNVPAHLALQISVDGKRNYSEHVTGRLINLYEIQRTPQQQATMAEFIAQATEYLQPSEAGLESISRLVTLQIKDNGNWQEAFISILQTPNDMRRSIFRGLGKGFAELIEANRLDRMAFILDWLKACNAANSDMINCRLPIRLTALGTVGPYITEEMLSAIVQAEGESAAACKARFDITGNFDQGLVQRFGTRLWLSSSDGPLRRLDWRVIDFTLMLMEHWAILEGRGNLSASPYARFSLALARSDLSSPIAITQAPLVVEDYPDPAGKFKLEGLDPELAPGLAIAIMGYLETSKNLRFSNDNLVLVLKECTKIVPEESNAHQLARDWVLDKSRLFQSRTIDHTRVHIGNILR